MYIEESVTQLVTVSNANSPIYFSQPLPAADRQRNYLDHMSTAAQQEQDRNRKRHQQVRGQQDLHTAACVPLSKFDEASVSMLDIEGRTAEC